MKQRTDKKLSGKRQQRPTTLAAAMDEWRGWKWREKEEGNDGARKRMEEPRLNAEMPQFPCRNHGYR